MKIKEALGYFEKLITETDEKAEIQIYHKFISILSELENKAFSKEQLMSIEKELDTFTSNADSENRKKHFKLKLNKFIKLLKQDFSLISEGYNTSIGIALGTSFGVAFGAAFNSVSYGLIFGMLIGLIIGVVMDSKAKKEGKVFKQI